MKYDKRLKYDMYKRNQTGLAILVISDYITLLTNQKLSYYKYVACYTYGTKI